MSGKALKQPRGVPVGSHFLVHDPQEDDWSLWKSTASCDTQLIDWVGDVCDPAGVRQPGGWTPSWHYHAITDDEAGQCLMLVRHTQDKQRWYDFAKRVASSVERAPAQPDG